MFAGPFHILPGAPHLKGGMGFVPLKENADPAKINGEAALVKTQHVPGKRPGLTITHDSSVVAVVCTLLLIACLSIWAA